MNDGHFEKNRYSKKIYTPIHLANCIVKFQCISHNMTFSSNISQQKFQIKLFSAVCEWFVAIHNVVLNTTTV